jgi:serine/threonine-protein kinase RsbW
MSDPAERGRSVTPSLRLQLDCSFAAVRQGALQIRSYLHGCGLQDKEVWACELAFVEGCNNAVQHTHDLAAAKKISVELSVQGGFVEMRINEHSEGCDFPADSPLPPADSETGRGIFLMRTLMDDVSYVRSTSSNCLVLKKALTGI